MVDLSSIPFLLRPCCPGYGTHAHVRGCPDHPEAVIEFQFQRCCSGPYGAHVPGCVNHPDTVIEFQRVEPLLWEGDQT